MGPLIEPVEIWRRGIGLDTLDQPGGLDTLDQRGRVGFDKLDLRGRSVSTLDQQDAQC